ncbi:MAG TPA: FkbM family methyltransferase [Anaerolineales bacterium]|nr:FkbM family methyltransferase [Anaerolineales bacterium]
MKLVPLSHPNGRVPLGEVCRFKLRGGDFKTRSFIKHEGVFYLTPVSDWGAYEEIPFYPMSPGKYVLRVEWRRAGGDHGWAEKPFEVTADESRGRLSVHPRLLEGDKNTRFLAPSEWESLQILGHESSIFSALSKIIKPGWVVYDIGANIGVYAVFFSRRVGTRGYVYCLEANPLCVYFLRANLELNRIENSDILPAALVDRSGKTDFRIDYGNCSIGTAGGSVFYARRPGQEVGVHGYSFDALLEGYSLKKPDLIKIDIEGAEAQAVEGMEQTLARHRPVLLIEIHGREPAEQTLRLLDEAGYRFDDPAAGEAFSGFTEIMGWMPNSPRQILCLPSRDSRASSGD